jgi:putative nucleotidyltransferase-like protein
MNRLSMDFFAKHFDRPEMKLLLNGCRRMVGSLGEREWEEGIPATFDEAAFSSACRENRMLLVMHKSLIRPYRERFSPAFSEGSDREVRRLAMAQLALSKSMIDIHRAFRSGNIRHLFLKGPALNGILYGEETLRCSKDLDVLIGPADIRKADAILAGLGFDSLTPRTALKLDSPFFALRGKDINYGKPHAGHTIELHWKTDRVETMLNRGIFDWDAHTVHVGLHNESLPVMEDYHNCLYLCLHAAKHHWMRLQWLLDIAMLMQRRAMDGLRLLDLADRYRLRRVVQEAFCLCRRLLDKDFGGGEPASWEKHAAGAVHRFYLANQPVSRWTNLGIVYHRSRLYPSNGPRQGFWIEWILDRTMRRSRKAAIRKTSSGITEGFSIPLP